MEILFYDLFPFQEIMEWARQVWRWNIGTTEIFHYFCVKWGHFKFWSGFRYAIVFTHYYGFVHCSMALFYVFGLISTSIFDRVGICKPSTFLVSDYLTYIPLIGILFAYLMFLGCFIIDSFATRLLGITEDISWIRNILHWISTPFVLLAYSCTSFFAITELAIRGKKVCTHGASKKEGLTEKV